MLGLTLHTLEKKWTWIYKTYQAIFSVIGFIVNVQALQVLRWLISQAPQQQWEIIKILKVM